jgi:hypothetical protein
MAYSYMVSIRIRTVHAAPRVRSTERTVPGGRGRAAEDRLDPPLRVSSVSCARKFNTFSETGMIMGINDHGREISDKTGSTSLRSVSRCDAISAPVSLRVTRACGTCLADC